MAEPELHFLDCPDGDKGHRMAYWQWGDPLAEHIVVCAHGLSRQGRDFDHLAKALVERAGHPVRVVCPDVVGRGKSDWLTDPHAYQIPTYVGDMLALLAHLKPKTLDWVGTSMGGLIGMGVCAHAQAVGAQVRRLVLNDVGPVIQWDALVRIGTYLGKPAQFESVQEAAEALWEISTSFGPHTAEQWMALSWAMVKPLLQGQEGFILHYDPSIAIPVRAMTREQAAQGEAQLWQLYDGLTAQTLLLRGSDSDLLSIDTAKAMMQRGPQARLLEFEGVGHAPTLVADDQIQAVASFLLD